MRAQMVGLLADLRSLRSHRATRPRSAILASATALSLLPVLGWAAVSLTEFDGGAPIYASEVNANFSNINDALEGPLTLSAQPVDTFIEACDPCVVANASLEITTTGGHVWIGFVPDPDDGGEIEAQIRGYGGNTPMTLLFYLERSNDDGLTWEQRGAIESASDDAGIVQVPPATVLFLDTAAADTWRYRVLLRFSGSATQADLSGIRLFAREVGS